MLLAEVYFDLGRDDAARAELAPDWAGELLLEAATACGSGSKYKKCCGSPRGSRW